MTTLPETEKSEGSIPGSYPSRRPRVFLSLIVLLWALIYIPGLFSPPLMDDADSIYAEVAHEMVLRHDFVTPHANGIRFFDKPPLSYWLTAASYKVFGVSEFSTRLPLSLAVLALLLATFWFGRDLAGDLAGFCSALVLATSIGPYIYTRFIIPDMIVCLWLTVTLHLLFRSLRQPRPSVALCWSIGAVVALNLLTKGLIGLVFPVAIFGAYLLLTGNLRHLLRLRPISTAAVFLAVAAPWHVLATLRNPPQGEAKGFFWFYFINEQINRYLNKRIPHDYNTVPLLLFWGLTLLWLFPWIPFLFPSLREVPSRWRDWRGRLTGQQSATLFLAIWALSVLVFFSFSTRLEYYVLPALPALGLLTGIWLAKEDASPIGSPLRRSGMLCSNILLALGACVFLITAALVFTAPSLPPGTEFAELLKKNPDLYTLSFGHFFDLTGRAMSAFRLPLELTGGAFLIGTLANWRFRRRAAPLQGNFSLAFMMVVLFYAVHLALITFSPVLGSKPLAVAIQREYRPGDTVVVDGEYSIASTINFYTGMQLHLLNGRVNGMWYGSLFPDAPKIFEDDASFARLWLGPQRVFFITYSENGAEKLRQLGAPFYEAAHSGDKAVWSNRPPRWGTAAPASARRVVEEWPKVGATMADSRILTVSPVAIRPGAEWTRIDSD